MALAKKDKHKVLFYLGWPGLTIIPNTTQYSKIISDRIDFASNDTDICALIKAILKKLANFDECLEKAKCRLSASKVGDITTNKDEIYMLNKERNRCIRELSDLLAISMSKSGGVIVGVCN